MEAVKIAEIVEFKKNKDRIIREDGSSLVTYRKRVDRETKELTAEEWEQLVREAAGYGKRYAMHLLEKRDYSRAGLVEKLRQEGYEGEIAEEVLAYLDGFHYLDDVRYAGNLIRSRKGGKSKREICAALKQRGISEADAETAMQLFYQTEAEAEGAEEPPEWEAIRCQLRKYHVTEELVEGLDFEEKQRLAAKLYRKGFASENIKILLHF